MIPKAERDADKAICDAATPDWRQGHHVGEPKALCAAADPDESLLMLDKDGMAIFWKEADAVAAVHCRNRLPAYIAAAEEAQQTIAAEIENLRQERRATRARPKGGLTTRRGRSRPTSMRCGFCEVASDRHRQPAPLVPPAGSP